jgi:hypothetical protein
MVLNFGNRRVGWRGRRRKKEENKARNSVLIFFCFRGHSLHTHTQHTRAQENFTPSFVFESFSPMQEVKQAMTCITCRLTFASADEQKSHYKTDLHRFNLKRKIAQLPPVNEETFEQKMKCTTHDFLFRNFSFLFLFLFFLEMETLTGLGFIRSSESSRRRKTWACQL